MSQTTKKKTLADVKSKTTAATPDTVGEPLSNKETGKKETPVTVIAEVSAQPTAAKKKAKKPPKEPRYNKAGKKIVSPNAKGKRGEYRTRDYINNTLKENNVPFAFERVPMSGGIQRTTADIRGDIVCKELGLVVEVKNYANSSDYWGHLFKQSTKQLIEKLVNDCKATNYEGILVYTFRKMEISQVVFAVSESFGEMSLALVGAGMSCMHIGEIESKTDSPVNYYVTTLQEYLTVFCKELKTNPA